MGSPAKGLGVATPLGLPGYFYLPKLLDFYDRLELILSFYSVLPVTCSFMTELATLVRSFSAFTEFFGIAAALSRSLTVLTGRGDSS
jgi:hypothetical protein